MSLADITYHSVEQALFEAESLGRDRFLEKYGFGPARSYFLRWNDANCDSKAIVGAAHGFLPGKLPLRNDEFSGGDRTVADCLRNLGFEIAGTADRNPSWTTDELILALNLYGLPAWLSAG